MSAQGAPLDVSRRPPVAVTLTALYRLVLRMQVTTLRVLGIGALGGIAALLAILTRRDDDPVQAGTELIAVYGIGLVLPLATLWLATASLGDLVEDRLLVYLRVRPVARWQLPAAALLATVTVVVPLVGLPLAAAALIAGVGEIGWSIPVAAALGSAAYGGLFVFAGLWLHRALWWGLLFILVWEGGIARTATGAARLSIGSYLQSLLADAADVTLPLGGRSLGATLTVPLVVAAAGLVLAIVRYRRGEID
jgi:ABC-2 type transport system permease protein